MKPFYLFIIISLSHYFYWTTLSPDDLKMKTDEEKSSYDNQKTSSETKVLDFRTAVNMMLENNKTIKAAEKGTELAKRQSQLINASWFPTITMTGTYTLMSNNIGMSQEYASLLEPLKEKYANTLLVPDVLNLISNELGDLSFDVPIFDDDLASIDLEVIYPVFTGVKRIYTNKLAKNNETLAEINKESIGATKYIELATIYFSLSLSESITNVLKENNLMTKNHYSQALKMEEIGMFDKVERLIVKVALDESDRSLKSAENQSYILKKSLFEIINPSEDNIQETSENQDYIISTPLFLNEKYPSLEWFKDMMYKNAYIFRKSEVHEDISKTSLKMSRSNYFPVISVFGKQTIASYNIPKNLIPNTIGGINMAWDIFDGLARERNIQITKIESEIISETQHDLKNELEVLVDKWYTNLKQSCINAKDLQSSLEFAEEVYSIRKKSFAEGLATSQQVLDALNLLNKTKLLLLTTYYEYDIALVNLCCLCGIPEYFESFIDIGQ